MKIVNRGYIMVKPSIEFKKWIKEINNDLQFIDGLEEGTCFLIEEDFWEEDKILEKYFRKIYKQECYPVTEIESQWPNIKTLEDFNVYFQTEFGTFVYDLLSINLTKNTTVY